MSQYKIITDTTCDLSKEMAEELGLETCALSVVLNGKAYRTELDDEALNYKAFYAELRAGKMSTTNAANVADFIDIYEPHLKAGTDLIVIPFSSGISATCDSANMAANELREQYPERKIYVVDSLCASLGHGLFLWYAAKKRDEGLTIDELRDWLEAHKLNLCHQFTVDDLNHLKRGGRVSAATALAGTMIGIKPLLHVDNEGHLIKIGTTRGRKKSLDALVDRMEATAEDPASQMVFISHGDDAEAAQYVADEIKRRLGATNFFIHPIGPVIGTHSGPGTVALFHMGRER